MSPDRENTDKDSEEIDDSKNFESNLPSAEELVVPADEFAESEKVILKTDNSSRTNENKKNSTEEDDDESFEDEDDNEIDEDSIHDGLDDPLGTSYDLEGGEPIRKNFDEDYNYGLPSTANVETAKEFFNTEILYRFDILEDSLREEKKGKYRFDLNGKDGGSWTLSVGNNLDIENSKSDADIVFTLDHLDFVNIVNGKSNPQLAILAKKLKIDGDLKKAIYFLDLLVPDSPNK